MIEAANKLRVAARLNQAVPVMFVGALNEEANGAYDPIYELHDEWPIYRKRETVPNSKSSTVLLYEAANNSWIIKCVPSGQGYDDVSLFDATFAATERKGKTLVTLFSGVASFPEMRLEGSNGIKESGSKGTEGPMSIIPELEWIGGVELEKLKRLDIPPPLREFSS